MSDEHYEKGFTIAVYLPPEAPKEAVDKLFESLADVVHDDLRGRDQWDPLVFGHAGDVFQVDRDEHDYSPHVYLSTSCHHGNHSYCQSERGLFGNKTPAMCKFCAAPCVCACHREKGK